MAKPLPPKRPMASKSKIVKMPSKINLSSLAKGGRRDSRIREDPRLMSDPKFFTQSDPRLAEVERRRREKDYIINELIPDKITIRDDWPRDPATGRPMDPRLRKNRVDPLEFEDRSRFPQFDPAGFSRGPLARDLERDRIKYKEGLKEFIPDPLRSKNGPITKRGVVERDIETRVKEFLMLHRTRYSVAELTQLVEVLIREHASETLNQFAILGMVEKAVLEQTPNWDEKRTLGDYFKRLEESLMRRR